MNIIEHLEMFLGNISQGWNENRSDNKAMVVCFHNKPFDKVDTFLTLGLSNHILSLSNKKNVRQELIFSCCCENSSKIIVSSLMFMCDFIIINHRALLRGQVIRLQDEVIDKLGFEALYCTIPTFMEDDFITFKYSDPKTVIVWLIPIYKNEAKFIYTYGWDKFEDILEESDPDLFSLDRESVV